MGGEKLREGGVREKFFLDKAGRYLNLDKYRSFLLRWTEALESYGTPREFVNSTEYRKAKLSHFGRSFHFNYVFSKNNAQRRGLMAEQKPYLPRQEADKYPQNEMNECFLCQNVAQGLDALVSDEVTNNIISDLGSHVLAPNRYPSQYGHSLSILKEHDDTSQRVTPQPDPKNKTTIYLPEERKTRGNVLSEDYLEAVIEMCDSYGLIAMRNHVLDGMSIPAHDHFHIFPEDLPPFLTIDEIIGKKERTDYGSSIYRPKNTPFDTLLICNEKGQEISFVATPILKKMEWQNQVFTLVYHQHKLFVSPRFSEKINDRRIQVGAGVPIHYLDIEEDEFLQRINKYVPMKGEFDWGKYL